MRTRHLRDGDNALLVPDGAGFRFGKIATLPTASEKYEGEIRNKDGILYACVKTGASTWEWRDIAPGEPGASYTSATLTFLIDGGGVAITTGDKGDLYVPYACTITEAVALADQSGSIVVDLWRDSYANFPPTDADSITASAPITISSATKSRDTTLTGWTTSLNAGDILSVNVDSATTITRCTIALVLSRSA